MNHPIFPFYPTFIVLYNIFFKEFSLKKCTEFTIFSNKYLTKIFNLSLILIGSQDLLTANQNQRQIFLILWKKLPENKHQNDQETAYTGIFKQNLNFFWFKMFNLRRWIIWYSEKNNGDRKNYKFTRDFCYFCEKSGVIWQNPYY